MDDLSADALRARYARQYAALPRYIQTDDVGRLDVRDLFISLFDFMVGDFTYLALFPNLTDVGFVDDDLPDMDDPTYYNRRVRRTTPTDLVLGPGLDRTAVRTLTISSDRHTVVGFADGFGVSIGQLRTLELKCPVRLSAQANCPPFNMASLEVLHIGTVPMGRNYGGNRDDYEDNAPFVSRIPLWGWNWFRDAQALRTLTIHNLESSTVSSFPVLDRAAPNVETVRVEMYDGDPIGISWMRAASLSTISLRNVGMIQFPTELLFRCRALKNLSIVYDRWNQPHRVNPYRPNLSTAPCVLYGTPSLETINIQGMALLEVVFEGDAHPFAFNTDTTTFASLKSVHLSATTIRIHPPLNMKRDTFMPAMEMLWLHSDHLDTFFDGYDERKARFSLDVLGLLRVEYDWDAGWNQSPRRYIVPTNQKRAAINLDSYVDNAATFAYATNYYTNVYTLVYYNRQLTIQTSSPQLAQIVNAAFRREVPIHLSSFEMADRLTLIANQADPTAAPQVYILRAAQAPPVQRPNAGNGGAVPAPTRLALEAERERVARLAEEQALQGDWQMYLDQHQLTADQMPFHRWNALLRQRAAMNDALPYRTEPYCIRYRPQLSCIGPKAVPDPFAPFGDPKRPQHHRCLICRDTFDRAQHDADPNQIVDNRALDHRAELEIALQEDKLGCVVVCNVLESDFDANHLIVQPTEKRADAVTGFQCDHYKHFLHRVCFWTTLYDMYLEHRVFQCPVVRNFEFHRH